MINSKNIFLYSFLIAMGICPVFVFAQSGKSSFGIIGGIGNYEYLHAGVHLSMGKGFYLETAAGFKPWNISSETYTMICLNFGHRLLKERDCVRNIEPFLQLKAIAWYFNNEFNTFVMIGIAPEVRLAYEVNSRLQLFVNGGIIYNAMLHYERKTNEEVGWPKGWRPSFSLQLNYRIKKVQ